MGSIHVSLQLDVPDLLRGQVELAEMEEDFKFGQGKGMKFYRSSVNVMTLLNFTKVYNYMDMMYLLVERGRWFGMMRTKEGPIYPLYICYNSIVIKTARALESPLFAVYPVPCFCKIVQQCYAGG